MSGRPPVSRERIAELAKQGAMDKAVVAALDRRRCPSPLFSPNATQPSLRHSGGGDHEGSFNGTTNFAGIGNDMSQQRPMLDPLQQLRMDRARRATPSSVLKRTSALQLDKDISDAIEHEFRRRPHTTSGTGTSNDHGTPLSSAGLPPLSRTTHSSSSHKARGPRQRPPVATVSSNALDNAAEMMLQQQHAEAVQHAEVVDLIFSQLGASSQQSSNAVVEAEDIDSIDDGTRDFSCVTFNDTTFSMFLSALAKVRGVTTLNLQYVTAPFGQEHQLVQAVASNPTPIEHVDVHCSSFAAHSDLCESLERVLMENRQRADARRARHARAENDALTAKKKSAWKNASESLWRHADRHISEHMNEEKREWQRLMEAWSIAVRYTRQRDLERGHALGNRRRRQDVFQAEMEARTHIMEDARREFDDLASDAWRLSRGALVTEQNIQRRAIWRMYCDSWIKASVSTKRRDADRVVELHRFEVFALDSRQSIYTDQMHERNTFRVMYLQSLEGIAAKRLEVRMKKDDEHRRFRQRHQEEEIALEQQRAKARMESMLHGGDGSGGNDARAGSPGGANGGKGKPFRVGDEEVFFRSMQELSTQIFDALTTIRKVSERCVMREGKMRETVVKYQQALLVPPRLTARVSADAPPTVFYDGQAHAVELESSLALQVSMDPFWTVRCSLLRDELHKMVQPYRQSRKECSQQLYPVMQDVERCYRTAGLQGQMAWPAQVKGAYIANSNQPNKDLMDHVEKLLLQSVKKLKLSKETIVCGVLRVELPEKFRKFGGLALDEAALVEGFRHLKPELFHCSKPISLWECTYDGVRGDVPVPAAMQVDKEKMLQITRSAQVTRRDDLYATDDPPSAMPTHRSGGQASHPPSARGDAPPHGAAALDGGSPRTIAKRSKPPRSTGVSPTTVVEPAAYPKGATAAPPPALLEANNFLGDDVSQEVPLITTTASSPTAPTGEPSPFTEVPERSPFAAAVLEVTIPTGVTPEQIEAVAKCIKFVPVRPEQRHQQSAGSRQQTPEQPAMGSDELLNATVNDSEDAAKPSKKDLERTPRNLDGGIVTGLLRNRQAILASVQCQLTLFTKGIRQRALPNTNWTMYGGEKSAAVLALTQGRPNSGPRGSNAVGQAAAAGGKRPPSPVPLLRGVGGLQAQFGGSADTNTTGVKRLNPLKALSIRKSTLDYTLSFLVAPCIIEFATERFQKEHDARGGPCHFLGLPSLSLFQPPTVVRRRKNPFLLRIVGGPAKSPSSRQGSLPTVAATSNDVYHGAAINHAEQLEGQTSDTNVLSSGESSDDEHTTTKKKSAGPLSAISLVAVAQVAVGDQAASDGSPLGMSDDPSGGETPGNAPFRGMVVTVHITQGASMSTEDTVSVETSRTVAAKQGQIFYFPGAAATAAAATSATSLKSLLAPTTSKSTTTSTVGFTASASDDASSLQSGELANQTSGGVGGGNDDPLSADPFANLAQFNPRDDSEVNFVGEMTARHNDDNDDNNDDGGGSHHGGLSAAEQIAVFEQPPNELRVTFLTDEFVTVDVVEATIREIAYRNISVDPTVGVRHISISIQSPVGVSASFFADVAITAADDPTDWAVHQSERVVYMPLDTAHAREWLKTLESISSELPPLPHDPVTGHHASDGPCDDDDPASLALKHLNSIVPAAVLRFADTVEVLDDDTTFFSAGHLRFALFNECGGVPLGASPTTSQAMSGALLGPDLSAEHSGGADDMLSQQTGVEQLLSTGEPCIDDGVGIFLDIPLYKTQYGLCMVPRGTGSSAADSTTTASGSYFPRGLPSAHSFAPSFGGAGGDIFDLYDDGYLQGTVRIGEQFFGHIARRCVAQPDQSHQLVAGNIGSRKSSELPAVLMISIEGDELAQFTGPAADTTSGHHFNGHQQRSPSEDLLAFGQRHTPRVCVHALSNEIHIEFARGGNGATVDAVQELLKAVSFVNLQRFPVVSSDLGRRMATINMLVGATTGRRDIMGDLLPDTNVNHPLHAVISIESRPSFLRVNPGNRELQPHVTDLTTRSYYPENSGPYFPLNNALVLPHSFIGGYLRVDLVDGFCEEEDRIDCVDRAEALHYQDRQKDEYNRKMRAGTTRAAPPAGGATGGHHGGLLSSIAMSQISPNNNSHNSYNTSSQPTPHHPNVPDLAMSFAHHNNNSAANFIRAGQLNSASGGGDGLMIETMSAGDDLESIVSSRSGAAAAALNAASLMRLPSTFATFAPNIRYGAVRLIQNEILTEFPGDTITAVKAATVSPSPRSLTAYSMHEFAKVNMLSSSAETVAAKSVALSAGVSPLGAITNMNSNMNHQGGRSDSIGSNNAVAVGSEAASTPRSMLFGAAGGGSSDAPFLRQVAGGHRPSYPSMPSIGQSSPPMFDEMQVSFLPTKASYFPTNASSSPQPGGGLLSSLNAPDAALQQGSPLAFSTATAAPLGASSTSPRRRASKSIAFVAAAAGFGAQPSSSSDNASSAAFVEELSTTMQPTNSTLNAADSREAPPLSAWTRPGSDATGNARPAPVIIPVPSNDVHGYGEGDTLEKSSRKGSLSPTGLSNTASKRKSRVSSVDLVVDIHAESMDPAAARERDDSQSDNEASLVTRSAMKRRGSHRSRSVVFHQQSLHEELKTKFDERAMLEHSLTNPVLHSTLLAASTGRRSSLFHLHRSSNSRADSVNEALPLSAKQMSASSPKKRHSLSTINRGAQELVWANRLKKILMERSDSFMFLLNKSCARLIADRLEHLAHLGVDECFVDDFQPYAQASPRSPSSFGLSPGTTPSTSFTQNRRRTTAASAVSFAAFNASRRQSEFGVFGIAPSSSIVLSPQGAGGPNSSTTSTNGCLTPTAAMFTGGMYMEPPVTCHTLTEGRSGEEIATTFCHRASGSMVAIFEPETVITPSYFAATTRSICFESRSRCTLRTLRIVRMTLRMYEEGTSTILVPIWVKPYDDPMEVTLRAPHLRYRSNCTGIAPVPRQQIKTAGTGGGAMAAAAARAKAAAGGPKKSVTSLGLAAVATSAVAAAAIPKDGIGALRLFPKEFVKLYDADTTHWDGGLIEVTITKGGTRGDCLCVLSEEQQRTVRKIFADRSSNNSNGAGGGGGGAALSSRSPGLPMSSSPPLLGEQAMMLSTSMMLGANAAAAKTAGSVSFEVPPLATPHGAPTAANLLLTSARSTSRLGQSHSVSEDIIDGHAGAVRIFNDPLDVTNSWILVAEPPFPTASNAHLDPSQHAQMDANAAVHGSIFGKDRTLHIKSAVDGSFVLRNIGIISVERAVQNALGSSMLDLERSKLPAPPTPYTSNLRSDDAESGGVSFQNPGGNLFMQSNPTATTTTTTTTAAAAGHPSQQNVVTLLRIDLARPPEDAPYNPRITLDVMKCLITNIGFFNTVPLEVESVSKTATIAIRDAVSSEPPAKQSVTIDCQPPFFYKPAAYCEPVLYTQRAAIENRFEFVFQRLKSMCCSPNGGDAKERMPLCTIDIFPTSGWLPRDTLMLRLSGSLYVLTQDGQVICSKEVVCKHTTVAPNSIRAEITKDCKGATWAKVAGFLALISYHFDMKDFGKDAPTQSAPAASSGPTLSSSSGPASSPVTQQGPALTTTSPSGAQSTPQVGANSQQQQPAAPNSVPQHDRLLALQITEPNVKDMEGRTESWALLQRISYSSGLTSDQ